MAGRGVWAGRLGGHAGAFSHAGAFGAGGAFGGSVGKVTAVGTGTITVQGGDGSTRTVDTTSSTKYFEMTTAATRDAIKVGEQVLVLPAMSPVAAPGSTGSGSAPTHASAPVSAPAPVGSSGTSSSAGSGSARPGSKVATPRSPFALGRWGRKIAAGGLPTGPITAGSILVIEPYATGTVLSVSSSEIVVSGSGGLDRDVLVTKGTSYDEAGTSVAAGTVSKGDEIFAWGSAASDPTQLAASHVSIIGPTVSGIVSSVSGSTISLSTVGGTVSVTTSRSTVFRSDGAASTLSKVTKGDILLAIGAKAGSGFDATAVRFGSGPSAIAGASGATASPAAAIQSLLGGLG